MSFYIHMYPYPKSISDKIVFKKVINIPNNGQKRCLIQTNCQAATNPLLYWREKVV